MSNQLTGGCRCGAVRYAVHRADPPAIYACHCRDCQTASGGGFQLLMPVPEAVLALQGELASWALVTPSGAEASQHYCAVCMTRIYSLNSRRPGIINIRAGTLDDSETVTPRAHIFVRPCNRGSPCRPTPALTRPCRRPKLGAKFFPDDVRGPAQVTRLGSTQEAPLSPGR